MKWDNIPQIILTSYSNIYNYRNSLILKLKYAYKILLTVFI